MTFLLFVVLIIFNIMIFERFSRLEEYHDEFSLNKSPEIKNNFANKRSGEGDFFFFFLNGKTHVYQMLNYINKYLPLPEKVPLRH